MKIIVHSLEEQTLVETFLEALHEEMLDHIQTQDMILTAEGEEPWLGSDDYDFLASGIFYAKVVVDRAEQSMAIENHNIYGVCTVCGTETNGTIDGGDVSLEEYNYMMRPESVASWKCETCYFKEED